MGCLLYLFISLFVAGYASSDSSPKYLGCYSSSSLGKRYAHIIFQFTVEKCFALCTGLDTRYAGLDSINYTCYCGPDFTFLNMHKVEDSQCKPCSDDHSRTCGGILKISLYEVFKPKENISLTILMGLKGAIDMYKPSIQSAERVLTTNGTDIAAVDYHYLIEEGFAVWNYQIFRFPLVHNESAEGLLLVADISCLTLTVDWVHDLLYWPTCDGHSAIMEADLDGSNQHELVSISADWVTDIVVDPYTGLLFWITDRALMSCTLDGTLRTVLTMSPDDGLAGLVLDMSAERVYFSSQRKGSSQVHFVSYNHTSSDYHTLRSFPTTDHLEGFGIFRSDLYYAARSKNVVSLYRIPLNDSSSNSPELLGEPGDVLHMKMVHPELQSPPTVDACTHKKCSHYCVVGVHEAVCRCPKALKIGSDGITCEHHQEGDTDLVLAILGGAATVLFVLLAAGVLMCLCDKLWSTIHPTVVALRSPGRPKRDEGSRQLI